MQSPARLEIRLRLVRSQGARPNSEFPGTERLESQLEQAASRRLCKQPRLYKHCAASARQRNSSHSRLRVREFLKARIFAQRVPERIELKIGCSNPGGHFEKMR